MNERDVTDGLVEALREHDVAEIVETLKERYEVRWLLSRSNDSLVFRALENQLDREVAIKVLPLRLSGDVALGERFHRAAGNTAKLAHPNIVPVYSIDSVGRVVFYVMPYIRGRSLSAILESRGVLPVQAMRQILADVTDALQYAHEHGVLHGQIRPDNILVDTFGRSFITDFGAALVPSSMTNTGEGITAEDALYLSPEQARAQASDARSDVYSLGVVAYQCLTGRAPFDREDIVTILYGHAMEELPRPLLLKQEQRDMFAMVEKMMAKQPERRFQSAAELRRALEDSFRIAQVHTRSSSAIAAQAETAPLPYAPRVPPPRASAMSRPAASAGPKARGTGDSRPDSFVREPADGSTLGRLTRRFGSLLKNLWRPSGTSVEPVFLGASAPRTAPSGSEFTARFVAHIKALEQEVKHRIAGLSPQAKSHFGVQTCLWQPGTLVKVRLAADRLDVSPAEDQFVWQGTENVLDFDVRVRDDAVPQTTVLKFDVFIDEVRVARLRLDLELGTAAGSQDRSEATAQPARTAFASYSAQDRDEVLGRVSSLRASAGLDVFLDCLSMRPGEKWKHVLRREIGDRDLFLLFWSAHAKGSEWVDWEWRTAFQLKGIEAIQPHPLDPVTEAPPPAELQELHFGDAYVLVRAASRRTAGGR